jgi:protease YdgD
MFMRSLLAILAASALIALPAQAEEASESTGLTPLLTAYDAQGWEAVGRLNIGYGGMCTGALIAPQLVLTAAHCMYDARSGQTVDPTTIKFHAGWRNGRASATRSVRRAVVHPRYEFTGTDGQIDVANDIALLELDSEIRLSNIRPFLVDSRPRKGQSVGVVSYAHNRAQSPSLQEVCHVLARQRGSLVLSCEVDFGSSGAPVFTEVDGEPRIVSVVSAKADVGGRQVSLGTNLEKPLSELRALMQSGFGLTAPQTTQARTLRVDRPRSLNGAGGAKFLRP